jgi:hypothetical protein
MSRFSFFGLPLTVALLWGALFASSLVLPSVNTEIFASPDETAVAVSLTRIAKTGSGTVDEPLAPAFPWLHPRSYVATGETIAPVGFLGWPWWLAQLHRVLPLIPLVWLASLLAASGVIPWYFLLRTRFGAAAAWWGTALAWTFPPVLLYVNRSFFSHLPQYSAALWALLVLVTLLHTHQPSTRRKALMQIGAGVLMGISLSFRPVEALWLLPLIGLVYASFGTIPWRKQGMVLVGMLLGLLPLCIVQAQTYGSWFQVGYWVQSNTDPTAVTIPQQISAVARPWYYAIAPYGLHPRNVLWNVQSFFLNFLWPWVVALGLGGVVLVVLQRQAAPLRSMRQLFLQAKQTLSAHAPALLIGSFVFSWLLLVYGSGLYTDHVRFGAITVANSFLRYTLPFGFFFAWCMASVYARVSTKAPSFRMIFVTIALILVGLGVHSAFTRDEEGILATRRELIRYATIREAARTAFQPTDVILSERSDKIFFPVLRAMSPMPTAEQIRAFARVSTSTGLGLFSRPLSFSDRDAWRKMGYDVRELQAFDRERLYRLTPFLR